MNQINRRPVIVAVFGGSKNVPQEILTLAACVGSEIAAQGFVILTGGTMKAQKPPKTVKDAALKGAARDGYWIGVLKNGRIPDLKPDGYCPDFKSEGKGGVVYSDMGHQRNLLEAWLCDAAIVLKGAEGTISEAVSALCLGKPVLLAGSTWTEDCSASNRLVINAQNALYQLFNTGNLAEDQKSSLVEITLGRLKEGNEDGVMKHLITSTVQSDKVQFREHSCFAPKTGPEEAFQAIAGWLTELQALPRTGEFPHLGGKCDGVKENYDEWLRQLSRPAK
jgi:uncharacterized protein (TIGR00725 family)